MQKNDSVSELQSAIQILETKQKEDFLSLKKEFIDIGEQMKPSNLLKEGIGQLSRSSEVRKALLVTGTTIVTGMIIHRLLSGKKGPKSNATTNNISDTIAHQIKLASFSLVKYALATVISQNSDKIKQFAYDLLSKQRNKQSWNSENEESNVD